jgi:hypothetical protein
LLVRAISAVVVSVTHPSAGNAASLLDAKETIALTNYTVGARFGAFIRAVSTYCISVAVERLVDTSPRVAGKESLVANSCVAANLVRTVKTVAVAVAEIRMRNALVATRTLQKMKSTPDAIRACSGTLVRSICAPAVAVTNGVSGNAMSKGSALELSWPTVRDIGTSDLVREIPAVVVAVAIVALNDASTVATPG